MAPRARVQKRLYYKIGEACKALGIQPYVLRYWETEFPALSPSKSRSGQRVYSEKELEVIRRIKELLYDEGYTIAGAKKKLESELAAGSLGEPAAVSAAAGPDPVAPPSDLTAAETEGAGEPPQASPIPAARPATRASAGRGRQRPGAAETSTTSPGAGSLGDPEEADTAVATALDAEPPEPRLAPAARQLDTEAAQRIQTLRTGIEQALQEARDILALLDS